MFLLLPYCYNLLFPFHFIWIFALVNGEMLLNEVKSSHANIEHFRTLY